MICPKCKAEYQEGFTICSDCGSNLIENKKNLSKNDGAGNWLTCFGKITAQRAISILFYLGILPFLFSSITFGRNIYLGNKYFKNISYFQDGQLWHTQTEVNNLPLGVFLGIVYFVLAILLWKIICELLIIIFRCFETYVQRNKQ